MDALPPSTDPSSPLHYSPCQTALLLLDYHNFVIDLLDNTNKSAGTSAVSQSRILRDWALGNNILVLHCLVDLHGKPPPAAKGADRLRDFAEMGQGKAGEEHQSLRVLDDEKEMTVLRQPGLRSALKSKGIGEVLAENGIKSLVICGLSTSGCVLSTAKHATEEGFVVTVVRDACGDRTKELHDMLMDQVLPSAAYVLKADESMEQWRC